MSTTQELREKIKVPNPLFISNDKKSFIDIFGNLFYLKDIHIRHSKFIHAIVTSNVFFENNKISFKIIKGSHIIFYENMTLMQCIASNVRCGEVDINLANSKIFTVKLYRNGSVKTLFNKDLNYTHH